MKVSFEGFFFQGFSLQGLSSQALSFLASACRRGFILFAAVLSFWALPEAAEAKAKASKKAETARAGEGAGERAPGKDGGAFQCGEYVLHGYIALKDGEPVFLRFKGSMSEIEYTLPEGLKAYAKTFEGSPVTVHGRLLSPVKNRRGSLLETKEMNFPKLGDSAEEQFVEGFFREDLYSRMGDPLNEKEDNKMELIKKLPCRK